MSWIAELDTHGREFPIGVHVTRTTHAMTHGATYVPIEDGKAVRDENAKLREILDDLHGEAPTSWHYGALVSENECTKTENEQLRELCREMFSFEDNAPYKTIDLVLMLDGWRQRMHELGIEADA